MQYERKFRLCASGSGFGFDFRTVQKICGFGLGSLSATITTETDLANVSCIEPKPRASYVAIKKCSQRSHSLKFLNGHKRYCKKSNLVTQNDKDFMNLRVEIVNALFQQAKIDSAGSYNLNVAIYLLLSSNVTL